MPATALRPRSATEIIDASFQLLRRHYTQLVAVAVVAEGVEDSTVAGLLVEADCDVAQGWHYGRPMRPNDVSAWLAPDRRPLSSWSWLSISARLSRRLR